jgi:hypothetical protein
LEEETRNALSQAAQIEIDDSAMAEITLIEDFFSSAPDILSKSSTSTSLDLHADKETQIYISLTTDFTDTTNLLSVMMDSFDTLLIDDMHMNGISESEDHEVVQVNRRNFHLLACHVDHNDQILRKIVQMCDQMNPCAIFIEAKHISSESIFSRPGMKLVSYFSQKSSDEFAYNMLHGARVLLSCVTNNWCKRSSRATVQRDIEVLCFTSKNIVLFSITKFVLFDLAKVFTSTVVVMYILLQN